MCLSNNNYNLVPLGYFTNVEFRYEKYHTFGSPENISLCAKFDVNWSTTAVSCLPLQYCVFVRLHKITLAIHFFGNGLVCTHQILVVFGKRFDLETEEFITVFGVSNFNIQINKPFQNICLNKCIIFHIDYLTRKLQHPYTCCEITSDKLHLKNKNLDIQYFEAEKIVIQRELVITFKGIKTNNT